jgi:hypothetical protein
MRRVGLLMNPGIAVADDGSVFVADTWNHRIQKFSPTGDSDHVGCVRTGREPTSLYGPRDVAIDTNNHVLTTDTEISE